MSDISIPLRVVVVDDERTIADSLVAIFRMNGYETRSAYSAEAALEVIARFDPHVLLADVIMGGMSGIQLGLHMAERYPECRVILLSGQAELGEILAGLTNPDLPFAIFAKPVHPQLLLDILADEARLRRREPSNGGRSSASFAESDRV